MWISLDADTPLSLNRQICAQIRTLILRGHLAAGDRLPSTRQLSKELHVARSTVIEAYDQLLAEGYLESRRGSGTHVAQGIRPQPQVPGQKPAVERDYPGEDNRFDPAGLVNFQSGIPALEHFPAAEWHDCIGRCAMRYPPRLCAIAGRRASQNYRRPLPDGCCACGACAQPRGR